jgi:hypothetical protein
MGKTVDPDEPGPKKKNEKTKNFMNAFVVNKSWAWCHPRKLKIGGPHSRLAWGKW